jgi:hypothetical protein
MNTRCPSDLSEFPSPKQLKWFRLNLELEDYINNYQVSLILIPISPVEAYEFQIETDHILQRKKNMSLKYVHELKIFLYQNVSLSLLGQLTVL